MNRRLVLKVGTSTLTGGGQSLLGERLAAMAQLIAELRQSGSEIVLVSSGAVAAGRELLGWRELPRQVPVKQMLAAVGQPVLMARYQKELAAHGLNTAQILLSRSDLERRTSWLNARNTLRALLDQGLLPIVNENDSVATEELRFGDNDCLSALVATLVDAAQLVLLTDQDGLYSANPRLDPQAQLITEVAGPISAPLRAAAGGSSGGLGTGGMASKLQAARVVTDHGIPAVICSGDTHNVLDRVLAGDDVGTVVWPTVPRPARRRTIAQAPRTGALVVNDGALAALVDRKASLLPIGVLEVEGAFERGDVVEIRDRSGRVFGRGLCNYDAVAARALAGHKSAEIDAILGYRGYDALVTRDNLVLTAGDRK